MTALRATKTAHMDDAAWAQRTASLAARFEGVSPGDASRALQVVDGHAGHAAKLLQQQLAQGVIGSGGSGRLAVEESVMSVPGSRSLPPPSPGPSGEDWRSTSPERRQAGRTVRFCARYVCSMFAQFSLDFSITFAHCPAHFPAHF